MKIITLGSPQHFDQITEDDTAPTLLGRMGTGGNQTPVVVIFSEYNGVQVLMINEDSEQMNDNNNSCAYDGTQISPTLTANNADGSQHMPDKDNFNAVIQEVTDPLMASGYSKLGTQEALNGMYIVKDEPVYCVDQGAGKSSSAIQKELSPTLATTHGGEPVISFCPQMKAESQCFRNDDICNTLVNGTNPGFQNGVVNSVVRRLTPLECERLQGFPDGWTNIGEWTDTKGKKHKPADAPRYKALGNSIALPFWEFLAARMIDFLKSEGVEQPTMASLFDGIGGFPLVYSRHGCRPVWASEIEEFPIAVTKIHFSESEGVGGDD